MNEKLEKMLERYPDLTETVLNYLERQIAEIEKARLADKARAVAEAVMPVFEEHRFDFVGYRFTFDICDYGIDWSFRRRNSGQGKSRSRKVKYQDTVYDSTRDLCNALGIPIRWNHPAKSLKAAGIAFEYVD